MPSLPVTPVATCLYAAFGVAVGWASTFTRTFDSAGVPLAWLLTVPVKVTALPPFTTVGRAPGDTIGAAAGMHGGSLSPLGYCPIAVWAAGLVR